MCGIWGKISKSVSYEVNEKERCRCNTESLDLRLEVAEDFMPKLTNETEFMAFLDNQERI